MELIVEKAQDLVGDNPELLVSDALAVATFQVTGALRMLQNLTPHIYSTLDGWQYADLYDFDFGVSSPLVRLYFLDDLMTTLREAARAKEVVPERIAIPF
jgi:hypothetical protein